jgi:deoxyribodipyrimidine photo-lyase
MKLRSDIDVRNPVAALLSLKLDRSVQQVSHFHGGEAEAQRRLKAFIGRHLGNYADGRREPAARATSTLAPYLHFGQISPVDMAIQVRESRAPSADVAAFLEELIVRRELSMNFVFHHPHYDQYDGLPAWAKKTLESHRHDKRYHIYTRQELQQARTHDALWNAAQREMNATGFMQNSMRMYWGKKVLEWKATPQEAYEDLLYLNNRYFLCGRDPTSYANVGWIFGLHDRPWQNRPIFGNVRYMNEAGLRRKFDMPAYLAAVDRVEREAEYHSRHNDR